MEQLSSRFGILLAITGDYERFRDLWTPEAARLAATLKLQVNFLERTPSGRKGWRDALSGYRWIITSWCTPELNGDLIPEDGPLQKLPNAFLSPQCAGRNTDRYVPAMLREVDRYLHGEPLLYEQNPEKRKNMTNNRLNYA